MVQCTREFTQKKTKRKKTREKGLLLCKKAMSSSRKRLRRHDADEDLKEENKKLKIQKDHADDDLELTQQNEREEEAELGKSDLDNQHDNAKSQELVEALRNSPEAESLIITFHLKVSGIVLV